MANILGTAVVKAKALLDKKPKITDYTAVWERWPDTSLTDGHVVLHSAQYLSRLVSFGPRVKVCPIFIDRKVSGRMLLLFKLEPNAYLPPYRVDGAEEILVLSGDISTVNGNGRVLKEGAFEKLPQGHHHEWRHTTSGCILHVHYFFEPGD